MSEEKKNGLNEGTSKTGCGKLFRVQHTLLSLQCSRNEQETALQREIKKGENHWC